MEVSKCWRVVEFPKISIKMKNWKIFYETQRASRLKEIIKPLPYPPPTNLTTFLEQKLSYRDIQQYIDIWFESASRMQFLEVKKWSNANVFSDTKQENVY